MEARFVALRFRSTIDEEEALQGFMLMNATVEGIEEASDGSITFYIPKEEYSKDFEAKLRTFTEAASDTEFLGSKLMEERDWNAEWESSIEPQRVTQDLLVTPSWKLEQAKATDTRYLIQIDPKMSFGTGHHETTRLCLASLETIEVADKAILDIGTGSGVLAIYALLRSAKSAIGVDTDPWSIDNAQENRKLNGVSEKTFEIRQGTLQQTIGSEEHFDVILANIHRNVLVEIAPEIRSRANEGAAVILSGLLIYDVEEIRHAYEAQGFRFLHDRRENEWACLTFAL